MNKKDIERWEQIKGGALEGNRINAMMEPELESYNEDHLILTFKIKDWMLNQGDVLHGGILATALDIALGTHTLMLERERTIVTTDMSIHYLGQTPKDATLRIKSRVNRNGNTLVSLDALAYLEDEKKPVASCICHYMKLQRS